MRLKDEYREETIINKSRFIACVMPCRTEEQARLYIELIRASYPDSSHVCTAYMLGENNSIQRSSDNKEPSGTAGVPMLESIRKSGLSDVCACVVRYFGGIKLGAGGLIRAYSGSVADALAHAAKVEDRPIHVYEVTYPYDMSGTVEAWMRHNGRIINVEYDEKVTTVFEVLPEKNAVEEIRNLSRGIVEPVFLREDLQEVDVN